MKTMDRRTAASPVGECVIGGALQPLAGAPCRMPAAPVGRAVVVAGGAPPPDVRGEIAGRWRDVVWLAASPAAADAMRREATGDISRPIARYHDAFAPLYSDAEAALVMLARTTSTALLDHVFRMLTPHLDRAERDFLTDALRLDLEDRLFVALRRPWAILKATEAAPTDAVVLLSAEPDWAASVVTILAAGGFAGTVWLDRAPAPIPAPWTAAPARDAAARVARIRDALRAIYASDGRPEAGDRPRAGGGTLLFGRPMDRNYGYDFTAMQAACARLGAVRALPSAIPLPPRGFLGKVLKTRSMRRRGYLLRAGAAYLRREARTRIRRRALLALPDVALAAYEAQAKPLEAAALRATAHRIRPFLSRTLPDMLATIRRLRREIARRPPDRIVCLPGRDWAARAACLIGQETGIPSYDIQTVFLGPHSRLVLTAASFHVALETYSADLLHAFFAMPRERILLGAGLRLAAEIRTVLAATATYGPGARPRMLFAASPILDDCLPVAAALVEAARTVPDLAVSIRLHPATPAEHRAAYELLIRERGPGAADISAEPDMALDIARSDLIATRFSNVGLAAALAGKPVLSCEFGDAPLPVSLSVMGIGARVSGPDGVAATLADWRTGGPIFARLRESQADFRERNAHLLDPAPDARLAGLLQATEARLKAAAPPPAASP